MMENIESMENSPVKVNLFNFEDPIYEDSKYVLTSPRSLEACSRIGVKPVDLLYKPLSDFQEELLPQDVPLRTIYNIYDEHERDRQGKLKLCRNERNRIEIAPKGRSPGRPRRTQSARETRGLVKALSDEELNKSKGSLQRSRTAWATSVGHKRISRNELHQRSSYLHEESMKLRNELLSKKDKTNSTRSQKKMRRSKSASSLSPLGTSLLSKSSIRDARPIENRKLRKTLSKSQDLSNIAVTPRDQKILELMMSKGEKEKSVNRDSFKHDLAWDEQRKIEEEARIQTEMRRRQMLAEENRIRSLKRRQKNRRREKEEEELIENMNRTMKNSMKDWERRSQTQLQMRDLQLSERREREELRKRLQESNKSFLNQDEEEMKELIRQKNERDLKSASQRKDNRLLQETMRKLLEDRNRRLLFEQRQKEIQKSSRKEEESLQASINRKHKHAFMNYQLAQQQRDEVLNHSRMEREKKCLHAKQSQEKLEDEMEFWRSSITSHRKMAEEHASEIVARKMEIKAKQAHENRVEKEQVQKENLKRLLKEEIMKRHDVEEEIMIKEQKAKNVELDKSLTIQKSREVAHQSQMLRNSLREKYGSESFDKKVLKVHLYNQLKLGQHVPAKCTSKS